MIQAMDKTTSFFNKMTTVNNFTYYSHEIIGWIAAILTVVIGIPQLIKLIKVKSAKDVSLVSNWIFFVGLIMWVIFGSFTVDGNGNKLIQTITANVLSVFVYALLLFFLHKYKEERTNIWTTTIVCLASVLVVAIFVIAIVRKDWFITENIQWVAILIGAVTGFLTTFAYVPQVWTTFKSKDVENLSLLMIIILIGLNIFWIIYWLTALNSSVIMPLVYQCISLVLYIVLLTLYIIYKQKDTKKVED